MSVLVKEVIEKLRLDIVYGEPELLEKEINTADITRPGLEMTGYFDYYTPETYSIVGDEGMVLSDQYVFSQPLYCFEKNCSYQKHQQLLLRVV